MELRASILSGEFLLSRFSLVQRVSFCLVTSRLSKLLTSLRWVSGPFSSIQIQWVNYKMTTTTPTIQLQLRRMDRHLIEDLDFAQKFQEIDIESEQENLTLKGVTFNQAMGTLQQHLTEMAESNFYKAITVHFAAKSSQKINYLEEHYGKREEILRLQLEEEKEYLKNIVDAKDELELQIREKEHQRNSLIVQKKKEEIKYPDFIPCLYIQGHRKNPIYGSINQAFDRKGMGNFTAKIGYRSPFKKYDSLEFNFEWPISSLRKRYYQAGVEWANPYGRGNHLFRARSANEYIFRGIDNEMTSVGWAVHQGQHTFEVDLAHRKPLIQEDTYNVMRQEFYRPSRKVALRYNYTFRNSITFEDVTQGEHSEIKTEIALPFLGHSNYFKIQYYFRKFFDTFAARKWIDNELARKFFWKSTLETNFSVCFLQEFGKHRYVNDVLESLEVRGYQSSKNPVSSFANAKASLKFNIHNYPVLQEAKLVTFLYAQAGLAFLKDKPYRPFGTLSAGLGISLYASPVTQIEVLCNAAQVQSQNRREPVNFQIRLGVFD